MRLARTLLDDAGQTHTWTGSGPSNKIDSSLQCSEGASVLAAVPQRRHSALIERHAAFLCSDSATGRETRSNFKEFWSDVPASRLRHKDAASVDRHVAFLSAEPSVSHRTPDHLEACAV